MSNQKPYYSYNGKKYARVTEILSIIHDHDLEKLQRMMGWKKFDDMWINAGERGTKFHKLTNVIERGKDTRIFYKGVDAGSTELKEALITYKKWLDINVKKILFIEKRLYCKKHFYGGTVDLIAQLKDDKIAVIDKKFSTKFIKKYQYQTSAYYNLCLENGIIPDVRIVLLFDKIGKIQEYKLTEVLEDYDIFMSCLKIYKNYLGVNYGKK